MDFDYDPDSRAFGRVPPRIPPGGVPPPVYTLSTMRLTHSRGKPLQYDDYSSTDEGENTMNGMKNGAKHVIIEKTKKKNKGKKGTDDEKDDLATPDDDSQSSGPPEDPVEPGMACDLKNLYSGKEDKRGRFQWQDSIPLDITDPVENAETAKYAYVNPHISNPSSP
jgi:hypothetical protein